MGPARPADITGTAAANWKRLLAFCVATTYLLNGSAITFPANQSDPLLLSKLVGRDTSSLRRGSYPHNARVEVQFKDKDGEIITGFDVCTGVLAAKSYVLTSAHCCQPRLDDTTIKAIAITIGATSIRYSDTFGVKPLLMHNPGAHHAILQNPTQGEEIHIPAGYTTSDSNPEWDVCLIELEDEDGRHARADIVKRQGQETLLPNLPAGQRAIFYGWGTNSDENHALRANKLHHAVSWNSACPPPYGSSWENGQKQFICVEGPARRPGNTRRPVQVPYVDAAPCEGDDGGPLFTSYRNDRDDIEDWGVYQGRLPSEDERCMDFYNPVTHVYVSLAAHPIREFLDHTAGLELNA